MGGIKVEQQEREYHKGQMCCYTREIKPCVEGFCDQCQIYLDWHERWKDIENKMDYKVGR